MFRVPINAENPSYDETFDVGFFQWLKSSKPERDEWARRRNAATKEITDAKLEALDEQMAAYQAAYAAKMARIEADAQAGGSERAKAARARLRRRYGRRRSY